MALLAAESQSFSNPWVASPLELLQQCPEPISSGFVINGTYANSYSGESISKVGDINNDGYSDIIIGAYAADPSSREYAGTSYVIYGGVVPTATPTTLPTQAPIVLSYIIKEVKNDGIFLGSSERENFIINSPLDVTISGGGSEDKFTILPRPNAEITITDFNPVNEFIDLSTFPNIHSINDFTITYGSAVINLPDNQKIRLLNHVPSDITEDNFIFNNDPIIPTLLPMPASTIAHNDDDGFLGLNLGALIGIAVGGVTTMIASCCAIYKFWCIAKPILKQVTKNNYGAIAPGNANGEIASENVNSGTIIRD